MQFSRIAAIVYLAATPVFTSAEEFSAAEVIRQEVHEIPTPDAIKQKISDGFMRRELDRPQVSRFSEEIAALEAANVILDKVINLGKKVWKIIEDGKPVVSVKYDYANALPKGVDGPQDLAGFSPLQFRSFRETGVNGFGVTVYDVTYTVVHRYGGSFKGKGRYLDAVAVVPQHVEVAWLYSVEFNVTKVSVANVGTHDNPVAAMTLESFFRVSTMVKELQSRGVFDIRGDSARINYSVR
jgi:hypothetical protein